MKGSWALFVMAAVVIRMRIIGLSECGWVRNQCPCDALSPIETKRATSPRRLVIAVIIPAASDFGFW